MSRIRILYKKLYDSVTTKNFKKAPKLSLQDFLATDIEVDDVQQDYIYNAFTRGMDNPIGFDTLNGEGGVGKTFTQAKLVQDFLRVGKRVTVLAPTHQALKVIQDKIPVNNKMLDFQTVARATRATIGISHRDGEKNFYANKLEVDTDALFLDEGSFVDEEEIRVILSGTVAKGIRLFVSGDACQLPKPKSGTISQLMDSRCINPKKNCYMTTLSKVYRTEGLGIMTMARRIRHDWVIPERRGLNFHTVLNYAVQLSQIYPDISVFQKTEENMRYIHELIAQKNGNVVYLAYTNECVDSLARFNLDRQFKRGQTNHRYFPKGSLWYATAPRIENDTIVMQNGEYLYVHDVTSTEMKTYYNTELKICELHIEQVSNRKRRFVEVVHPDSLEDYQNLLASFDADALKTEGRKERKKIWLQKAELMDTFMSIKYAPFITGHKSQGSEYPVVIIDLKDVMKVNVPFVLNRLLYVMISRAKQHLVFMI